MIVGAGCDTSVTLVPAHLSFGTNCHLFQRVSTESVEQMSIYKFTIHRVYFHYWTGVGDPQCEMRPHAT